MKNISSSEYIEDLIATTVGVEPLAMYYVLEKMEDQLKIENTKKKDPMLADHVDDNYVWFECPMNLWLDSQPEIKQALEQLGEEETVKHVPAAYGETTVKYPADDNFVWFEPTVDQWLDSQPNLRQTFAAMEDLIQKENAMNLWSDSQPDLQEVSKPRPAAKYQLNDNFVWFEPTVDQWLDSQPDLRQAFAAMEDLMQRKNAMNPWLDSQPDLQETSKPRPAANNFQVDDNFVWFESSFNLWLDSQPELRRAFEDWGQQSDEIAAGNCNWSETPKTKNKEKVA